MRVPACKLQPHKFDPQGCGDQLHFPDSWEMWVLRFDLTDFEWDVIQPVQPTKMRGVKRADDRKVLNGTF